MLHDREVVSNEEISRTELVLELLKKVQNLGLNGYVKCRDRLVTDCLLYTSDAADEL